MSEIRASSLPKLAECPVFVGASGFSAAAERGTIIDRDIRDLIAGNAVPVRESAEDNAAIDWGAGTLRSLADGSPIETREEYLQMEIRHELEKKTEKHAQKEIAGYLRMRGLQFICPPMNKRSLLPEGWPDFTLAFRGHALAFEVKAQGCKPRPEQIDRHDKMRDDGWIVHVVHGVADVIAILQLLEAKK